VIGPKARKAALATAKPPAELVAQIKAAIDANHDVTISGNVVTSRPCEFHG